MRQDDHDTAEDSRCVQAAASAVQVAAMNSRPPEAGASSEADGSSACPRWTQRSGAVNGQRSAHDCTFPAGDATTSPGWIIEIVISPFHCLYQDALSFHTQSRLARSVSEASRLARAALLLYVSSAEALVHQAAEELGRPELKSLLADPSRPLPLYRSVAATSGSCW